jgi:hypothetical protein
MPDLIVIQALERQLAKYDAALAEFMAIDMQLRSQEISARASDMIRINRETINSMTRSAELVRERLGAARLGGFTASPANPLSRPAA